MKKIKVGIVGCGGIAKVCHIPAYLEMENVEVVATCDIIADRASSAAEMTGAKYVFTDWNDLISLSDLDMVDICTPNYLHAPIAIGAMLAGKHAFCEKPDSITIDEVLEMKATSEKTGKHLMVMRNNRFREHSEYAKRFMDEGKCGDVYAGRCGYIRRRGIPGMGGWFTTKAQSGGGPLIDLGVHIIDMAIWLMGNPKPVAVSGSVYTKFADAGEVSDSEHSSFGDKVKGGTFDVEDLAIGMIRFDNGACLQIEFSWASNIEAEKYFVELRGTKAGIDWDGNGLMIYTEDNGVLCDIKPVLKTDYHGHAENLQHFIDVLTKGAEPLFKPIEGVNMVKILTNIYESAKLGKEISID